MLGPQVHSVINSCHLLSTREESIMRMQYQRDLRSREHRQDGGSQQDAGVPRSNCVSPDQLH